MKSIPTIIISILFSCANIAVAQTTAFTYQGQLTLSGSPASGNYDLSFTLYDASQNGNALGNALTNTAVAVTNAFFTTTLDFGTNSLTIFNGSAPWLEIAVRTNGGDTFVVLAPRQQITPAPYAITASKVTGPVSASQITGALTLTTNLVVPATVSGYMWVGNGGTPTVTTNQPGSGAGAAVAFSGPTPTDSRCQVGYTTGNSPSTAAQFTVTFSKPLPYPPLVFMETASLNAPLFRVTYGAYILATTTNFTVYFRTAPPSQMSYTNSFWIIQ